MQPIPDQPPPEGWVYIEHPVIGRSENPVTRGSLHTWIRGGWTEVPPDTTAATPPAPTAEQASPAPVEE